MVTVQKKSEKNESTKGAVPKSKGGVGGRELDSEGLNGYVQRGTQFSGCTGQVFQRDVGTTSHAETWEERTKEDQRQNKKGEHYIQI